MITNTDTISDIVKKHLNTFPLFTETHKIVAQEITKGNIWIAYFTGSEILTKGTTHFEINIIDETCYLLDIELERTQRGKGHGKTLYALIENFAREIGCDRVRMNPSGRINDKRTRKDYLLDLGYTEIGPDVEKIIQ